MKHYNEDRIEKFDENRLKNLADNYNFDIDCKKDAIKSAWEFATQGNYHGYEFNVNQVAFWESMADFWMRYARRERIYVVED